MSDININARVPENARSRVLDAIGYKAKMLNEEGEETDNPESEEEFVARYFKDVIRNHVRRNIKRKKRREAIANIEDVDIEDVDIIVNLV